MWSERRRKIGDTRKMHERIITSRIVTCTEDQLSKEQCGFGRGREVKVVWTGYLY